MTLNKDQENKITPQKLASLFHDTYETLAPSFGYETRKETREFNPKSTNGKLMIAVCKFILETEIKDQINLAVKERENELKQIAQEYKDKGFELETFIYSGFIKDLSTSPKE